MIEYNTCDKCGIKENTFTLVWIDSEDFEPSHLDNFSLVKYKIAIKKYSALCGLCYIEECCLK